MRLTHFAFALTVLLLGVTAYLAWEGQQAKREAYKEVEFWRQQKQARETADPAASQRVVLPAASITPPPVAPAPVAAAPSSPAASGVPKPGALANDDEDSPIMAGTSALPGGGLTVPKSVLEAEKRGIETNTLTSAHKNVLAAKAVGRVKLVVKEQGFLVLDAGSDKGIAKGQKYEIRRDSAVLGKVTISDSVEAAEAVADMDLSSVPPGVTIEPGDEIIEPLVR